MRNKFQRLQGQEWQVVKHCYKLKLILISNEGHIRGEYVKISPCPCRYNVSHYLNDGEVKVLKSNLDLYNEVYNKGLQKLEKQLKKEVKNNEGK